MITAAQVKDALEHFEEVEYEAVIAHRHKDKLCEFIAEKLNDNTVWHYAGKEGCLPLCGKAQVVLDNVTYDISEVNCQECIDKFERER